MYNIDDLTNRREDLFGLAAGIVEQTIKRWHRAEVRGAEHIPQGRALYVGNHNSLAYCPEMYLLALAAYEAHGISAVPYGLAHEVLLSIPGINQLLSPLGAVRASHENGERILNEGFKALVYPGSDFDACRPWHKRNEIIFGGRRGYIKLALKTHAPVVPVVAAGAHSAVVIIDDLRWVADRIGASKRLRIKVFPLMFSFPFGLTLGPAPFVPFPSRILMEILEPIHFERTGPDAADDEAWVEACDQRVRDVMQEALTRLATEREAT